MNELGQAAVLRLAATTPWPLNGLPGTTFAFSKSVTSRLQLFLQTS